MKSYSPVKLLVRRAGSNKFLRPTGRWTTRADAAANFPSLFNAINTCLARRLNEVELIVRFEGEANDQCFRLHCR